MEEKRRSLGNEGLRRIEIKKKEKKKGAKKMGIKYMT
jgi:hypothetical protein